MEFENVSKQNKTALVISGFGAHFNADGEAVKGLMIENICKDNYKCVLRFATLNWGKNPIKFLFNFVKICKKSDDIFFVVAENGSRFLVPFTVRFLKKGKRLFFVMVGMAPLNTESLCDFNDYRTITDFVQSPSEWERKHNEVSRAFSKMDCILVETNTLKLMCEKIYGLTNVVVFPNFRNYQPVGNTDFVNKLSPHVFSFVFFARISPSKGLDLLVEAAKKMNDKHIIFKIDVYGVADQKDLDWFKSLKNQSPKNVCYHDPVFENKIAFLSSFDCMVLPSLHIEGLPGSIVESFFAGVPVIVSNYTFAKDLVDDGITGFICKYDDSDDLAKIMAKVSQNPSICFDMKENCLKKSLTFSKESAQLSFKKIIDQSY